jgi:hypothetical protein
VSKQNAVAGLHNLVAVAALCASVATPLEAAPVKLEALITPKTESKLEFADGSKRYLLATQREGKAQGTGPLAGATMLEFGAHDVTPGVGSTGSGYLVFTTADGDIAYLKYQFRMLVVPGAEGKPHPLITGHWVVGGGTGKLLGLRGAGTVHVKVVSPKERHWILDGDLC